MNNAGVRGRFAPTPSGRMHLGNAWAALCAWLHVRGVGGQLLLRIEDIDTARCRPAYVDGLLSDLRWLGIDWDEGPDLDGPVGPYTQSQRGALYSAALARLQADDHLYPCFCSRAQLAAVGSAPHGLPSEGAAYPGTCRLLSAEERTARAGEKAPALRFRLPDEAVAFEDLALGPQHFPAGFGGDFIVRRADGLMAYQLAVVVDDAAQGISHVVRGADLLDSTPRQLWLYQALGTAPPAFAHIPLLVSATGQRLSKRDPSLTIAALREQAVPASRIIGALACLAGWTDTLIPLHPRDLVGQPPIVSDRPHLVLSNEIVHWLLER